jgi:hypothetical protein
MSLSRSKCSNLQQRVRRLQQQLLPYKIQQLISTTADEMDCSRRQKNYSEVNMTIII